MRTAVTMGLFVLLGVAAACTADEESGPADGGSTTASSTVQTTAAQAESDRQTTSTPTEVDGGPCDGVVTGVTSFELVEGSTSYGVRVYVPGSFDGTPLPVVLNWHGLGSDGPQQAQLSGYEAVAEREGFIVVHPTGSPGLGQDLNGWELPQFDAPGRDDIAFADRLIDELIGVHCADESRVYSTGMSNGGFFTSRLICELGDRLAAAASVAGTTHDEGCRPSRPVPYLSFHGTADAVVGYAGGGSVLMPDGSPTAVVDFFDQVMLDEFGEFADDFGCADPSITELSSEVTVTEYLECDDDVVLRFYTVVGGGHTWPGSPLGPVLQGLGLTTDDINATELSWEFFAEHDLA